MSLALKGGAYYFARSQALPYDLDAEMLAIRAANTPVLLTEFMSAATSETNLERVWDPTSTGSMWWNMFVQNQYKTGTFGVNWHIPSNGAEGILTFRFKDATPILDRLAVVGGGGGYTLNSAELYGSLDDDAMWSPTEKVGEWTLLASMENNDGISMGGSSLSSIDKLSFKQLDVPTKVRTLSLHFRNDRTDHVMINYLHLEGYVEATPQEPTGGTSWTPPLSNEGALRLELGGTSVDASGLAMSGRLLSKADASALKFFLVRNDGALSLTERTLHALVEVIAPTLAAGDYLEVASPGGIQAFDLSAIGPFTKALAYLDTGITVAVDAETDYLIVAVALGADGRYHAATSGSSLTSLTDHTDLTEVYDVSGFTTSAYAPVEGMESATLEPGRYFVFQQYLDDKNSGGYSRTYRTALEESADDGASWSEMVGSTHRVGNPHGQEDYAMDAVNTTYAPTVPSKVRGAVKLQNWAKHANTSKEFARRTHTVLDLGPTAAVCTFYDDSDHTGYGNAYITLKESVNTGFELADTQTVILPEGQYLVYGMVTTRNRLTNGHDFYNAFEVTERISGTDATLFKRGMQANHADSHYTYVASSVAFLHDVRTESRLSLKMGTSAPYSQSTSGIADDSKLSIMDLKELRTFVQLRVAEQTEISSSEVHYLRWTKDEAASRKPELYELSADGTRLTMATSGEFVVLANLFFEYSTDTRMDVVVNEEVRLSLEGRRSGESRSATTNMVPLVLAKGDVVRMRYDAAGDVPHSSALSVFADGTLLLLETLNNAAVPDTPLLREAAESLVDAAAPLMATKLNKVEREPETGLLRVTDGAVWGLNATYANVWVFHVRDTGATLLTRDLQYAVERVVQVLEEGVDYHGASNTESVDLMALVPLANALLDPVSVAKEAISTDATYVTVVVTDHTGEYTATLLREGGHQVPETRTWPKSNALRMEREVGAGGFELEDGALTLTNTFALSTGGFDTVTVFAVVSDGGEYTSVELQTAVEVYMRAMVEGEAYVEDTSGSPYVNLNDTVLTHAFGDVTASSSLGVVAGGQYDVAVVAKFENRYLAYVAGQSLSWTEAALPSFTRLSVDDFEVQTSEETSTLRVAKGFVMTSPEFQRGWVFAVSAPPGEAMEQEAIEALVALADLPEGAYANLDSAIYADASALAPFTHALVFDGSSATAEAIAEGGQYAVMIVIETSLGAIVGVTAFPGASTTRVLNLGSSTLITVEDGVRTMTTTSSLGRTAVLVTQPDNTSVETATELSGEVVVTDYDAAGVKVVSVSTMVVENVTTVVTRNTSDVEILREVTTVALNGQINVLTTNAVTGAVTDRDVFTDNTVVETETLANGDETIRYTDAEGVTTSETTRTRVVDDVTTVTHVSTTGAVTETATHTDGSTEETIIGADGVGTTVHRDPDGAVTLSLEVTNVINEDDGSTLRTTTNTLSGVVVELLQKTDGTSTVRTIYPDGASRIDYMDAHGSTVMRERYDSDGNLVLWPRYELLEEKPETFAFNYKSHTTDRVPFNKAMHNKWCAKHPTKDNLVFVWSGYQDAQTKSGVYAMLADPYSQERSAVVEIKYDGAVDYVHPCVAVVNDTTFVVAYKYNNGNYQAKIYYNVVTFDADTMTVGESVEYSYSTDTQDQNSTLDIVALDDARFMITWNDFTQQARYVNHCGRHCSSHHSGYNYHYDIQYRIMGLDNALLKDQVVFENGDTNGGYHKVALPSVGVGTTHYCVVYQYYANIYMSTYTLADYAAVSGSKDVNDTTDLQDWTYNNCNPVAIESHTADNFVIAWYDNTHHDRNFVKRVYVREMTAAGTGVTAQIEVDATATKDFFYLGRPEIFKNADGYDLFATRMTNTDAPNYPVVRFHYKLDAALQVVETTSFDHGTDGLINTMDEIGAPVSIVRMEEGAYQETVIHSASELTSQYGQLDMQITTGELMVPYVERVTIVDGVITVQVYRMVDDVLLRTTVTSTTDSGGAKVVVTDHLKNVSTETITELSGSVRTTVTYPDGSRTIREVDANGAVVLRERYDSDGNLVLWPRYGLLEDQAEAFAFNYKSHTTDRVPFNKALHSKWCAKTSTNVLVFVWSGYQDAQTKSGVYAMLADPYSQERSAVVEIKYDGAVDYVHPCVAVVNDTTFVVAYKYNNGNYQAKIYYNVVTFDADTMTVGESVEYSYSTDTQDQNSTLDIVALDDARFMITWNDFTQQARYVNHCGRHCSSHHSGYNYHYDIQYRIMGLDNALLKDQVVFENGDTNGGYHKVALPSVGVGTTHYCVVYQYYANIYMSTYTLADYAAVSGSKDVNDTTDLQDWTYNNCNPVAIESHTADNFVIAWYDNTHHDRNFVKRVYVREMTAAGTGVTAQIEVDATATKDFFYLGRPEIFKNADGYDLFVTRMTNTNAPNYPVVRFHHKLDTALQVVETVEYAYNDDQSYGEVFDLLEHIGAPTCVLKLGENEYQESIVHTTTALTSQFGTQDIGISTGEMFTSV